MVYAFAFLDDEFDFLALIGARRNRYQRAKASVTPQLAANAVNLTDTWPNLAAGVIQSLASAGVGYDHPTAAAASRLAGRQRAATLGGAAVGQTVNANWFRAAGRSIQRGAQRAEAASERFEADVGERLDRPASAVGSFFEPHVRGLAGITRTAGIAAESAAHEFVSRPITAVGAPEGVNVTDLIINPVRLGANIAEHRKEIGEAYGAQTESVAQMALRKLVNGEPVDVGSGFLGADPTKGLGKRHRQGVEAFRRPSGQFATPGRTIIEDAGLNQVVEPGTRPYQLLSGLVDLGLAVFADPAGKTLGAAAEARRAERTFGAALKQAGGVGGWVRKTVDPQVAASDWLDTNRLADRAVGWLAKTDDFTSVWDALGRRGVPREVVRRITGESDGAAVREILRENLTTHMRVKPTGTAASRTLGGAVGALTDLSSATLGRVAPRFDRPTIAREVGELFGVGAAVRHSLRGTRAFAMMPRRALDMENLDDAQHQLFRALQTSKLPDEQLRGFMNRFSQIGPDDLDRRAKSIALVKDFHTTVASRLTDRGIASDLARRATRMFDEFEEDLRVYYQQYGDDQIFEGAKTRTVLGPDGRPTVEAKPSAQLLTEFSKTVPLFDDLTEFRRMTGIAEQLAAVIGKSVWDPNTGHGTALRMTANGWSHLMSRWSQGMLARLAWPTRVTMEQQVRIASAGLDSAFNHPIAYMQWAMQHNPETAIGKGVVAIANRLGVKGVKPVDVFGDAANLAIQRHQAMNKNAAAQWAGVKGRQGLNGDYVTWWKADRKRGYEKAWAGELSQLWADPIASRLAGGLREGDTLAGRAPSGNNIHDVHRWLYKGNGRKHLEDLATAERMRHILDDPDALTRYLAGGRDPDTGEALKGVWQRIQYQTGGDRGLIDAIGSGRLDDMNLRDFSYDKKKFYAALHRRIDSAPESVKAPIGLDDPKATQTLDRAVDRFFEHLFTIPDNILSRIPAYDQNYWRRMTELTAMMDEPVARQAAQGAKNANIPSKLRRQLESRVSAGDGSIKDLEVADLLAKDFALAETKKLLYDAAERSNFAEGTRFVTAFAEAWKEIATTWSRRLVEDPQLLRRAQQGIEGARESDPTDLLPPALGGDGDPSTGTGFFFRDPTTDREMFAYPGLGVLAHKLIGLPGDPRDLEQQASAAGLNLFSASVLPGLGPVTQLAVSELLPDKPEWDAVRNAILPFGADEIEGAGTVAESLLPAWASKMQSWLTGDRREQSDRTWAATVHDVGEYLAANDPSYYDDNGMLDQRRLEADSTQYAKDLMLLRGVAQFTLPTGPAPEFHLRDESGKQWAMSVLGDELRKLQYGDPESGQEALGHTEGLAEFVERFGKDALLATEGRTSEIRKRALSKPGAAWERAHPEQVEAHRDVIGFFAPESPDDFDIEAWSRVQREGDRVPLTSEQRIDAYNSTAGQFALDNARRQIEDAGLSAEDRVARDYLAFTRKWLDETYPGWNERPGVGGRLSTENRIRKIEAAVEDPVIADTAAGEAARDYLQAREQALAAVSTLSPTAKHFKDARATAPLREWLRMYGDELAADTPEFAPMWEQVFRAEGRMNPEREYDEPTEELTGAPALP